MPWREVDGLKIFSFDLFNREDIIQGFYSRHGGVSPEPWASLNVGGTVGDERMHVVENRRRIFDSCKRPVESIFDSWQVHGTEIICAQHPRPLDRPHQKADGILTDRADITLFMRFADCVPIVLFDPQKRVIGLVHAGWRGTVTGVAGVAVRNMVKHYGCNPSTIFAGIGPSICVDHYQVGEEVVMAVQNAFEGEVARVLQRKNGSCYFDLWQANHIILKKAGVQTIEHANICTFSQNEDWYSHRAENGKTGRFAAILALNSPGLN
jgi:YfiH family protein